MTIECPLLNLDRYIYPPSFRTNMAENWSMPSIHQWWLPDDIGYPPIIRAIRAFIEERTTRPRNQEGEDVRSMKAMFSKLNFDDSPKSTPESSSSIAESGASFSTSNFGTGQPWNDSVPTSTTGDMGYDSMMNSPTQMQAHPAGMGMLTGSDSINVDSSAMSLDPSMMHDLAAWGMSDVNKPDQPGYHPQGP